ncbi:hypothetical protein SAMN05421810_103730 [Amycolatopsis arida]|uniref:Uncharacterized protein n=1 Tax=Amycolatopsis arida TaxID=587909 RepID=A0A1I5TZC1_9PSEU|nr:DUF6474 family protein [Amycolatopsis arida]TDX95895.1 hypothetical protein CLV69_10327 [Amycolatopsis arida]SFP88393.1 hypothetical protein SAMN05421810_103730 [Amycolatopsis arida]
MARKAAGQPREKRTPEKRARSALRVAKVLGPAVIPVVAPLAVHAAAAARETYDRFQARRLGVDVDRLPEFSGHGAALHARIAGLADGLDELAAAPRATAGDTEFAGAARERLAPLAASVRAAERMPAIRRKAAHRAVAAELDRLESELLRHLGVNPNGG